jgi:LacI family transcriptional regulator
MATIYEVSKLAGVSLATVSRVTNNNTRVSDKTRKKVVDAMAELAYRPNAIAQSLASNRSNSIGVMVSELNGPFFGQMMAGIEKELREAGKHVIITTGQSKEDKEKDGIEFLLSRNCDALIVHIEALSDEYLRGLNEGDTPVYFMSRTVEGLQNNCINLNNELGGYLATQTLIEQGHKQVAYIAGPQFKPDSKDRFLGHKRALKENNIAFDPDLYFEGDFKCAGGQNGIKSLLNKRKIFSALVCANDEMASGAMTFAREHDIKLPEELSIVGFDNIIFSQHLYPKLTTVDYPVFEMGQMAAKLVLKNVYHQNKLQITHFFEPTLITRDSVSSLYK